MEILDKDTALEMEQTESDDIFFVEPQRDTILSWSWIAYSLFEEIWLVLMKINSNTK